MFAEDNNKMGIDAVMTMSAAGLNRRPGCGAGREPTSCKLAR